MSEIFYGGINQLGRQNFTPIYDLACRESKKVLQPSPGSLERSFETGMASTMFIDGQMVGYVRFSPLLQPDLKKMLGVESLPDIWEIGTGLFDPDFRGNGHYKTLRHDLLTRHIRRINNDVLVLGTTKQIAVACILPKARDLGIEFSTSHHSELPSLAAFTCTCHGDFGQGYKYGEDACRKRIQGADVSLDHLKSLAQNDGTIPCVMYVSSSPLAQEMNQALLDKFGSTEKLVSKLEELNYYEN